MSKVKIWIHAVWATKNRMPVLTAEIRKSLFQHIKENALQKGIYIDFINGHLEHVHCLMGLNADLSIAEAIHSIKGEVSHWANKNSLVKGKLEWADEYFAVSVSESMIEKVRDYIRNQEEHHKKVTFSEEYKNFIERYKL